MCDQLPHLLHPDFQLRCSHWLINQFIYLSRLLRRVFFFSGASWISSLFSSPLVFSFLAFGANFGAKLALSTCARVRKFGQPKRIISAQTGSRDIIDFIDVQVCVCILTQPTYLRLPPPLFSSASCSSGLLPVCPGHLQSTFSIQNVILFRHFGFFVFAPRSAASTLFLSLSLCVTGPMGCRHAPFCPRVGPCVLDDLPLLSQIPNECEHTFFFLTTTRPCSSFIPESTIPSEN